jgi:hypothetical protein
MTTRRAVIGGTLRCSMLGILVATVLPSSLLGQSPDTTVVNVPAVDHPKVATLVEELTLGEGPLADGYEFSNAFVFAGRNGSVFVVDLADPSGIGNFRSTVRQYDSTGRFIRAIGRPGSGPGEYIGGVGAVTQLPDGRIILSCSEGLLVYSASGVPMDKWRARAVYYTLGSPILVDPKGFVMSYGAIRGLPSGPLKRPTLELFLYRFRLNGELVDSISPPETEFQGKPDPYQLERVRLPFGPKYLTTWSPLGYFVTSYTTRYAVDLRLPTSAQQSRRDGSQQAYRVRSVRRIVPAVPVATAERADWRKSVTMFSRSPTPGPWADWQWSGPDIPESKPPIRDLTVDGAGRIWVTLSQPAQLHSDVKIPERPATPAEGYDLDAKKRWVEPTVFDVFEPSGRYLGQVRFPQRVGHPDVNTAPAAPSGDHIWAVLYDADGVPTVKRYRIRWPE